MKEILSISRQSKRGDHSGKALPLWLVCVLFVAAACSSLPVAHRGDDFIERVYAQLVAGNTGGALKLFDQLSPEDAASSRNLVLKSSILYSDMRFSESKDTAEEALAAIDKAREQRELTMADTKDMVEAQFVLSNIAAIEGRTRDQKALLDAIVRTDPVFVPALNTLGRLALNSNQVKTAGSYYDNALKIAPNNRDALMGRAAAYRLERKPKEALRYLNEVIARHPNEAEPFAQRGRVYREMGNLKDSLSDLDMAKSIDSNDYWIAYDRGRTLLAMENKREALLEFERAEKINSGIFASYIYSAGIRDDLNDYTNALRDYERLVKLKPDYYFAYEMLGIHYMREGRYHEAKEAFRQAYARAPQEYHYALLSVITGLYAGDTQAQTKPFIEDVLRKFDRSKPEYSIFRLFYDFAGDNDIVRKTGMEKDLILKAKNMFYLAHYYSIRGNTALAQKFFEEFRALQRKGITEWRIYEWVVEKQTPMVQAPRRGNS